VVGRGRSWERTVAVVDDKKGSGGEGWPLTVRAQAARDDGARRLGSGF
jgi:hypothetical protein